ncbi:cytochrome P450 monooxygenase [Obba rivulosa]|uniref:Cytochrome P450 monooxygenase n=1 Tax=Obba rivulosa TaxID=1052685 RepID=A0A8E2B0Q4_9APHY|nr:cytochrome P450 monooxygenase [Obba rivulosa]
MAETSVLAALVVCFLSLFILVRRRLNPLHSINTIGPSAPLLSYIGAYRFFTNAQDVLREGYQKFKGSTFKVAMMDQWVVVVNGPNMVEELRGFPDEKISFLHAVSKVVQPKYTMGFDAHMDPYHITLVRERLNRNLGNLLPDVIEELELSMKEYIPTRGNEWTSVLGFSAMQHIVGRVTSRLFVGTPKCRDLDYLDLAVNFMTDAMRGRALLSLFPSFIKPFIGVFLGGARRSSLRATKHLKPIIEEREKSLRDFGENWPEKPNDMLMWLMEEARGRPEPLEAVIKRILALNFAAMNTSSNSVTHALYHLAENPEIASMLREDAIPLIKEHGWTKAAFSQMWKLDSFLKESQRFNGLNGMGLVRVALDDLTLSDGTRVPRDTIIAAGSTSMHKDGDLYPDPDTFNPLRFLNTAEGGGIKLGFASPRADYIAFGRGRHACPGRFYADLELKAIIAHIALNFEVKFDNQLGRPKNEWIASTITPAQDAKLLFRKREM